MLTTRPLTETFGVEVLDLDIARATEDELRAIEDIYDHYNVVLLRNQNLTAAAMMAFSERFGAVEPQLRNGPHPEFPGISVLTNKAVAGKPMGVHRAGMRWHTDGTTMDRPGLTTVLYGIEVPDEGGDTLLADARAAFNSLPEAKQRELEQIKAVHSLAYLIENQPYRPTILSEEERAGMPVVEHPIVLTGRDGQKSFYLTLGSTRGIVGMSDEEGREFMADLVAYATQDQFVYRHKWQAGDVLIWNDVCTLHCATLYDDSRFDRLVYRTWIRPVADAA